MCSHQTLAGCTSPSSSTRKKEAGWWVEDSSEFLICRGVEPDDAGCHAGDRTASILSCVAKKRSIGGMALGRRKEEKGVLRFFFFLSLCHHDGGFTAYLGGLGGG